MGVLIDGRDLVLEGNARAQELHGYKQYQPDARDAQDETSAKSAGQILARGEHLEKRYSCEAFASSTCMFVRIFACVFSGPRACCGLQDVVPPDAAVDISLLCKRRARAKSTPA